MRSALISLVVLVSVLHGGSVCAQDDAPWWRQLFGQETGGGAPAEEDQPVDPDLDAVDAPDGFPASDPIGVQDPEEDSGMDWADEYLMPLGSAHLDIPLAIRALDTLIAASDEVVIPGFRVQLFMGPLDTARALRHQLRNGALSTSDVHLVPYPPSFGVQVGDFRTPLAAYRMKRALEARFPDALVVPAALRPEDAFPVTEECVRTP